MLSPTMFSVYINDLAEQINNIHCGITIDDIMVSILLYADDIVLVAPDSDRLQRMLNVVTEWCDRWKLSVNPAKTKIVHFRSQSFVRSDAKLTCSGSGIEFCDSYKYLGVWFDEHLTMTKAATELAKSASRALGVLFGKMIATGGLSYSVYTKLYSTMVEPILFYGSSVWGTKQYNVINAVQNKACKYFLGVGKYTSNTATRGDMGWTSCMTKQRIASVRLYSRILRIQEGRIQRKIFQWADRRRKGWNAKVRNIINSVNGLDLVTNLQLSQKHVMKQMESNFKVLDNQDWHQELFNDRNNQIRGNKLRTYRQYKSDCKLEPYIKCNIPRFQRRTFALFRAGALPLAVETGRYSRPPVPYEERTCLFCNRNVVENEKHFLIDCPLYSDLRYDLFHTAAEHIQGFYNLSSDDKLRIF